MAKRCTIDCEIRLRKGINFITPFSLYQAKNSIVTNIELKNWLIQWGFLLYLRWGEVQKEVFLLLKIIRYQPKRCIMSFIRIAIVWSSSFELMRNENMSPVACGCCRPVCRINFPPSLSPNLCWTQPMEPSSLIIKHFFSISINIFLSYNQALLNAPYIRWK